MSEVRKSFEHWYSDGGAWPQTVERNTDGAYKYMAAHTAWVAWQAAFASFQSAADRGEFICSECFRRQESGQPKSTEF
jgi:hypothetical protein